MLPSEIDDFNNLNSCLHDLSITVGLLNGLARSGRDGVITLREILDSIIPIIHSKFNYENEHKENPTNHLEDN